jgi:hypothetical protein
VRLKCGPINGAAVQEQPRIQRRCVDLAPLKVHIQACCMCVCVWVGVFGQLSSTAPTPARREHTVVDGSEEGGRAEAKVPWQRVVHRVAHERVQQVKDEHRLCVRGHFWRMADAPRRPLGLKRSQAAASAAGSAAVPGEAGRAAGEEADAGSASKRTKAHGNDDDDEVAEVCVSNGPLRPPKPTSLSLFVWAHWGCIVGAGRAARGRRQAN